MDAQTGMLAQLFGRSMVLGPEREVSGVWSEERGRGARAAMPVDDALEHAGDEGSRKDAPQGAGGRPRLVAVGLDERHPGEPQLRNPVRQEGRKGVQEHRLLRDDDIPQARSPGLPGPGCRLICYLLETAKSPKVQCT